MLISERMEVATCLETSTSWVNPQVTTLLKQSITTDDNVNATQICKESELKERTIERHHQGRQNDTDKTKRPYTEKMQFSGKYDEWKPDFTQMMQKYESMSGGHLGKVTVTKNKIVLNPPDAPPIRSAPYRAGLRQQKLEREEITRIKKACVVETAVTEWASPILFVRKKDNSLRFCVDHPRLNAVTVRDSYPVQRTVDFNDSLEEVQRICTLDTNSL